MYERIYYALSKGLSIEVERELFFNSTALGLVKLWGGKGKKRLGRFYVSRKAKRSEDEGGESFWP